MIDPSTTAVLIRPRGGGKFEDKTAEAEEISFEPGRVNVRYRGKGGPGKKYRYLADRVVVVTDLAVEPVPAGTYVEVEGQLWRSATQLSRFATPDGPWVRVFRAHESTDETYRTVSADQVRLVSNAADHGPVRSALSYLRRVVDALPADDPMRDVYKPLDFVHPDSALARYLQASPLEEGPWDGRRLFPYSSNLSQRRAAEAALKFPISVIDGPPGTGKTQTILNILATLIGQGGVSVGVVSSNNAAVDNVRDKLIAEGIGFTAANLGRKEKREEFFARQDQRNAALDCLRTRPAEVVPLARELDELAARLDRLQQSERELAQTEQNLAAHRLEQQHFHRSLHTEVSAFADVPLAHRSSDRILDYLVETQNEPAPRGPISRRIRAVRRFFRYGPMRGLTPDASNTVLRLQEAYYTRRIAELEGEAAQLAQVLDKADLPELVAEHQRLSTAVLDESLRERYAAQKPREYRQASYRSQFAAFVQDYPVILSTCHSLHRSVPDGFLLDYLIIDEASQADIPLAAAAMSCCRNLVVVGDQRQLGPIVNVKAAEAAGDAPHHALEYRSHSILSSLIELYGPDLPRTMLREHYRCDPEIIGFCNEKFYDGQLIPFTTRSPEGRPIVLVRTVEGNHMREHRGGGHTNERERDAVIEEVIPQFCAGMSPDDIGVTSPYRGQVGKMADRLDDGFETDTVHRFQGRQKKAVIMSTVLDDTWRGRRGIPFVDDARLINVAVSRAIELFVLVTDHSMLPASRHLRDLMGYAAYHDVDNDVVDSQIVSVFDLLYRRYSERLDDFASRIHEGSRYRSENIAATAIQEVLAEPQFHHLRSAPQVLLQNLLRDLDGLTDDQREYARHRASVDFVIFNTITKEPVLAVEVDGFAFHENNPEQAARDELKDAIFRAKGLSLLRLATTGNSEPARIRAALEQLV